MLIANSINFTMPLRERAAAMYDKYEHPGLELDAAALLYAKALRNRLARRRPDIFFRTNLQVEALKSMLVGITSGSPMYSIDDLIQIQSPVAHHDGEDDEAMRLPVRLNSFTIIPYSDLNKERKKFEELGRVKTGMSDFTVGKLLQSLPLKTGDDIRYVIGLGVLLETEVPA